MALRDTTGIWEPYGEETGRKQGDNRVDLFCFQLYWFIFSRLRYYIYLCVSFMLLTVTERYKTEKLPYDTHTPPPKIGIFWTDPIFSEI